MKTLAHHGLSWSLLAFLFTGAIAACSSDDGDDSFGGTLAGNSHSSNGGRTANGGSSSASGGGVVVGQGGTSASRGGSASVGGSSGAAAGRSCRGVPLNAASEAGAGGETSGDGEACAGVSVEAESIPLDIYIMMDRSVSMEELVEGSTQTRWEALRDAMQQFVEKSADSNVRAGIGFFGRTGGRDDALDCDVSYYAKPKVGIGAIGDVGGAIVEAIEGTFPGGLTPTLPALEGAIEYAQQWGSKNRGRATAVVLVTDGYPTQCHDSSSINTSIGSLAEAAKLARESEPYVRTFVVGLAAGFNLETIAAAGGTEHAYLVDEGNVTDSFADTLSNISDSSIACEYDIPEPPDSSVVIDEDKVSVVYTPSSGGPEEIPRLESADACARNPNGGWYYDSAVNPTRILVCPCTCSRFAAGRVDVRLGCEPYIGVR